MIKRFIFIVALVAVGISLIACSGGKSASFTFKSGSVEVALGEDASGVIDALGKASSYDEQDIGCGNNEMAKIYSYSGFEIKTYPDNNKDFIDTITIKSDSVSTPEGVTIGTSREEVIKTYGDGYEEQGESLIYKDGKKSLNFVVRGGTVTSIYYDYDFD